MPHEPSTSETARPVQCLAVDIFRHAASYVDRILRGAKPADLPVQFPTKFEMGFNLRTAKALNLAVVPPIDLLRANEVIGIVEHSAGGLGYSRSSPDSRPALAGARHGRDGP